jgi:hypothetical protein
LNPYDICVANRKINGQQQTVTWHVDDLKSSHVDSEVNDNFAEWCEATDGIEDLGHVKVVRGKIHDYLAMILDFTEDGALKIDMRYYIEGMMEEFPYAIGTKKTTPWTEKLLKVQKDAKKLEEERRSIFHTYGSSPRVSPRVSSPRSSSPVKKQAAAVARAVAKKKQQQAAKEKNEQQAAKDQRYLELEAKRNRKRGRRGEKKKKKQNKTKQNLEEDFKNSGAGDDEGANHDPSSSASSNGEE